MKNISKKVKHISTKFLKVLMLISIIFSSLQTPIYVLADELSNSELNQTPEKGDMRLGEDGEITKEGTLSVTAGSPNLNTEGNVQIIKTVTEESEGKYKVDFLIKGKDVQNISTTTKPIYFVIVFDRSGSMICDVDKDGYSITVDKDEHYTAADGTKIRCVNQRYDERENALTESKWENAVSGAIDFASQLTTMNDTYVSLVTFSSSASNATNFIHGTYEEADFGHPEGGTNLSSAIDKAQNKLDSITDSNAQKYILVISDGEPSSVEDAKESADNAKDKGTKIYSIGYGISANSTAEEVLKYVSSNTTVTPGETWRDEDKIEYTDNGYYQLASTSGISSALKTVFESVGEPSKAGTDATLTDGIGGQFKIVTNNNEEVSGYGISYVNNSITEITEEGTTLSFYIQINEDAPTGWYNTNENFSLTYTNANGELQTIECKENPQVYWVQNQYDYIVNYYKDSIADSNLLATETRQAPANTIINESNVEKDKYLNQAGNSYEFDSLTPSSITITNDGTIKVINVLYVKAYGNLKVNYVDTEGNILLPSVTTIKEKNTSYQTEPETIYGYTLKEVNGNETGVYIANETIEVTYVYTKNKGSVDNNEVVKTQINEIIGVNSTFNYVLSYKGTVNNYLGTATITLEDTLPYDVLTIEYPDGCTYDELTRKLTCTKTVELNENNQTIDATFNIKVTYKNLTSLTNLNVLNKVTSTLAFGETKVNDESEVTDTVLSGKVTAEYVDESNNTLSDSVTTTGLVDTEYKTNKKEIYGYALKEIKGNEEGTYTKEDITVTYVYTKNAGNTEKNEVTKEGPANIESVNDVFNYTLTYNGKITDYVGNATLTITDTLPYEIDLEKSTYDDRCTYENKVLTCTETYEIDKENQEINEEFKLSLVFINIDSEKVTNKIESTLDYGKTPDKDTDETETEVLKGKVISNYVDESNNTLSDSITTTGLVDTEYKTTKKEIYGYTLKEIKGNEEGTYTKEDITVTYVYSKNTGKVENNEVIKTQTNPIIGVNSTFKYTLTYQGTVKDYIGNATVTLTDTLPYDVLTIEYPEGCTYDELTRKLTCTKTVELNENNQTIDATFNIEVTYNNLTGTSNLEILNKVTSTLKFDKTEVNDESEVTDTVLSGKVTAEYVDESNNTLSDSVTTTGLVDTEYKTNEKEIYGYTLKEIIGNEEGKYTKEDIIVTYVYSKNDGTTETNEVEKTGPENITSVNGVFNYTLTYKGKITDYVGKATLTLKDTLPYEIDEEKSIYDDRCTYENKVLTCTETYEIDKENQEINEEFKLSLVFINIDSEKVTNKIESTLDYGKTPDKDTDETETEVLKGKVIANYVDESNNTLSDSITTNGLAGTNYETNEKTIYGYTLKEVNGNETGIYIANETIEVTYVYTKNKGSVDNNEVLKTQINSIIGANSTFNYVLSYKGTVNNYLGSATITLEDTLPYDVLTIEYPDGCTYDELTRKLTCTKTVELNENNQTIDATFNIKVTYKNLTSLTNLNVLNKVTSTLAFGETKVNDESEVTDTVLSGKVTANYVDESNNTLSDSVTTTGLVDTEYKTNKKEIYGYALKEIKGNEEGTYTKEDITVTYVYTKNAGTTETNEVTKEGPENITSVNGVFNYTLTYKGKITDYVGKATLTLKDTLPYEIDEELSIYDDRCTYENKVLTCTETYEIDKENQEINEEFKLSVVFKNIDSEKVTNKVESILDYGKTPDKDNDETETEVYKGTVVATYKNKQGETLADPVTTTELAGTNYETTELEFLGYTLINVPENKNGQYLANRTIYVEYIYDKNIGTSEEELEKVGPQKVTDITKPFEYNIKYNLEVFDYIGEVKITLTDHLPYEIDEEKSLIGNTCQYTNGKIICEYLKDITSIENSKISIEENLILYYKNIISNEVTNKVDAKVVYGEEEKINNDEFTTEIPYGTLKVRYITEDGKSLSETIISTNLVGTEYNTEQKSFDNYYLKEVIGETSGVYTETEKEVVYVYSLVPLPPQTGLENNLINYINLLLFTVFVIVIKKRFI